ncbi:MAG: acylphosphatase [Candidatus Eremiobacteraeota bacterium]|nr:acylphosphatase [Candidatus Eremiobacteraeota bacterium]
MKAERVVLHGCVQGVFFRATVRDIARRHPGISGWVRNAGSDGLEMHVEGDAEAVDAFVHDVLANPPPAAEVERIIRTETEPEAAAGFAVRDD